MRDRRPRRCRYFRINREQGLADSVTICAFVFFFSSRRRHTRLQGDWSSDVCSSDLLEEKAKAPTPERVAEIEATLHRDTAAFVDAVAEQLGEEGRWFHYGLTSSDVVDTALSLQIQAAGRLVLEGLSHAFAAVAARGDEHRTTICMGRTHGVHAEP